MTGLVNSPLRARPHGTSFVGRLLLSSLISPSKQTLGVYLHNPILEERKRFSRLVAAVDLPPPWEPRVYIHRHLLSDSMLDVDAGTRPIRVRPRERRPQREVSRTHQRRPIFLVVEVLLSEPGERHKTTKKNRAKTRERDRAII